MTLHRKHKLIVALSAILSASVLVGLGLIDDGVYATIMVTTVGGFLTANVAQKKIEGGSS